MDAALASGEFLNIPLFVMYGAKDEIVPRVLVQRFVDPNTRRVPRLSSA
jgi:hypothetical protein